MLLREKQLFFAFDCIQRFKALMSMYFPIKLSRFKRIEKPITACTVFYRYCFSSSYQWTLLWMIISLVSLSDFIKRECEKEQQQTSNITVFINWNKHEVFYVSCNLIVYSSIKDRWYRLHNYITLNDIPNLAVNRWVVDRWYYFCTKTFNSNLRK